MKKSFKIYGLFDPRDNQLRYIGYTRQKLSLRLWQHINELKHNSHKIFWIKSLLRKGLSPFIFLIEEIREQDWEERERFWIKTYRDCGFKLTNCDDGGLSGKRVSLAARLKMSRNSSHFWLGKNIPEDIKEKMRLAKKGVYIGEENPFYGKSHSIKTKKALSFKRKRVSDETIIIILKLRKLGRSLTQISKVVNIAFQTVSKIVNRKPLYMKDKKWDFIRL